MGDLEAVLAPFKQKIARLEELRKSIREHFAASKADESFELRGSRFLTLVGPTGMQRLVNCSNLFKLVGPKVFLKCASVSLKALEAAAGPAVVHAVVETHFTGPRTVKTFAKAA
jgi:hypothetical protein